MKFQMDFNILKGLNVLSGKKDIRYYLNGIGIEITSNGAYFVATDGHKLGIYHDHKITSSDKISYIVPNDLIMQVSKQVKAPISLIDIELSKTIEITYLNNTFKALSIDGTYPDFRKVIPENLSHEIGQFNPDYLSEFKKCASIMQGKKEVEISIGHNGNSGSIISIDDSNFLGVIMPYKTNTDFTNYKKPLWIDYQPIAEPLKAVA